MGRSNEPVGFELSVSARNDGTLEAIYVRFSDHKVAKTEEVIEDVLLVDLDSRNELIGIEILAPVKLSDVAGIVEKSMRAPFRKFIRQAAPSKLVYA